MLSPLLELLLAQANRLAVPRPILGGYPLPLRTRAK